MLIHHKLSPNFLFGKQRNGSVSFSALSPNLDFSKRAQHALYNTSWRFPFSLNESFYHAWEKKGVKISAHWRERDSFILPLVLSHRKPNQNHDTMTCMLVSEQRSTILTVIHNPLRPPLSHTPLIQIIHPPIPSIHPSFHPSVHPSTPMPSPLKNFSLIHKKHAMYHMSRFLMILITSQSIHG